ncbi:oysgedart [Anaeramoeba flamelloides]|uniref:Oysgedart n=1 Tax=Anaeramoeba flamelloides TaxID=1746091 RepID=A0ABQ8Z3N6_9EUKA|nr:oysgedart [Anaeramoeba flamelloides]
MSGFAYGGMDEVGDFNWNFLNGVDLKSVFLPIHTDKYLNNWHLQTSSWFKEYVYFRIAHPDSPFQNFFAQLVTLLIISFWNGLRRCYYTLYLFWPFWFFADKLLTKSIKPFLNDSSGMTLKKRVWFFKIVLGVLTNLYWSVTLTVFFVCLKWRHTLILLRLTRYPTFIVPIFIIIICSLFLKLTEGIRKGKTTNINRKKVK